MEMDGEELVVEADMRGADVVAVDAVAVVNGSDKPEAVVVEGNEVVFEKELMGGKVIPWQLPKENSGCASKAADGTVGCEAGTCDCGFMVDCCP